MLVGIIFWSINTSETIKFNVTANQSIDTWNWSIDTDVEDNNYDNFTTSWDTTGIRNVSGNVTNSNGSDTITWKVTVQEEEPDTENGIILSWEPEQIVDYIYVNDTVTETIKYSITTSVPMENPTWTVDGIPVTGTESGYTYSYTRTWDNQSIGPHKIVFTGNNSESLVVFKWYVNVYEIVSTVEGAIFFVSSMMLSGTMPLMLKTGWKSEICIGWVTMVMNIKPKK